MPPRASLGVTLVELLTVLVVVALLAAIAVPSYRSYVVRSQRVDAQVALLRVQAAQEKFFLQHNRYADALTAAPPDGLGLRATSDGGLYALRLVVGAGEMPATFVAEARPVPNGGQGDDARCQLFSIDSDGLRIARNAQGADRTAECWR
jgi:type IV pilus assembly protein PilE